jgi:hypothetical protein
MIDVNDLLQDLPPFTNKSVLIEKNQEIHDIIKEVLNAHEYFAADYDLIYKYFDKGSIYEICKKLYDFCKKNIYYRVESEDKQTTKSPAAILETRIGDCKHYAGFIGGVLDAICRNTGEKINWFYRFASYSFWDNNIEHVFVVVLYDGNEIWIDPVLSKFDSREEKPNYFINKKVNSKKMLNRISGLISDTISNSTNNFVNSTALPVVYDSNYLQSNATTQVVNLPSDIVDESDMSSDLPQYLINDIKMLLYYGVINENLEFNNDRYVTVLEGLGAQDQSDLSNAYGELLQAAQTGSVAGFFGDIWGAFKQVSLVIPRGAYLSLVSLNVFNLAGHLNKCITNTDGSVDQNGIDKLQKVWHGKLRGDTNILLRAIRNGASKKAILGIGVVQAAAWAVTAATIIAAMAPIIKGILQSKNSYDSLAASQLAMQPTSSTGSSDLMSSLQKYLPLLIIGGAAYYVMTNKKK